MPKDNKRELFYLVDDNDEAIGSVERFIAHRSKTLKHRSIFILLVNDQDELLLQKRSQFKDSFPGYWTVSVSGHVTFGQTYDEAAKREMEEEIGLVLDLKPLQKIYIEEEREFAFIYKAHLKDEEMTKISFDQDEISEVRWVAVKKLTEFIKENDLTPSALKVLKTTL